MPDVGAILVAAGRGTRLSGDEPKQFARLEGRALFTYALRTLCACDALGAIVVVLPAGEALRARARCDEARIDMQKVTMCDGGETRQESVRCGLEALPACTYLVVHDAARPFVTASQIERVVQAARRTGAATLALRVTDTLMRAALDDDAAAAASVDRDRLWAVQTPQAFERDLLEQAHAQAKDAQATDDGSLVLALGRTVALVEGDRGNLKVTTPDDLESAREILQRQGGLT